MDDVMSFEEIAEKLNMSVEEVIEVYNTAMYKIRMKLSKGRHICWKYDNGTKKEIFRVTGLSPLGEALRSHLDNLMAEGRRPAVTRIIRFEDNLKDE